MGSDISFAWPSAEIAVMGPQGAVEILHRKDLASAADPAGLRDRLAADYTDRLAHPYIAAERGFVDDVIEPPETRRKIAAGLRLLGSKQEEIAERKHGNVPL